MDKIYKIEKRIARAARKAAKKETLKEKKSAYNFVNSKALFVLKIITMSFFILTCVIVATVLLTRWISDINRAVKASKTKISKATARLNKFRKERIKHILKLRKLQLKEEKESRRYSKKHGAPESAETESCYADNMNLGDA